ncbi:hypothetical protein [Catellatospora vulcania]|uniref:hypothetical protein n=1 Tax=Catellatospora vulcania TaxID=1460450 RepID=UPI0012D41BBA|nr:hypothetical protein [Catellatospora vulcania]
MTGRLRRTRWIAGVAVLVGLLASTAAGPVRAAGPGPLCVAPTGESLYDTGPVLRWNLNTYWVTTASAYWSVVSVRGSQGYNPDLVFHDQAKCVLATSADGSATRVDWVAFDNNSGRLPIGSYPARVFGHPGNTSPVKYQVQFVQGRASLSTTSGYAQPVGTAFADWQVDIRDVHLTAGTTYLFTVNGGVSSVHLLGSTGEPASWARTAATADRTMDIDPAGPLYGVLAATAPRTGWYGLLFVRDSPVNIPLTVHIEVA